MVKSICLLPLIAFLSCTNLSSQINDIKSDSHFDKLLSEAVNLTIDYHFSPQNLDDSFAEKFFNTYLNELDPERIYFLQEDITFLEQWKYQIDDQLKNGNTIFFKLTDSLFRNSLNRADLLLSRLTTLQKPPSTYTKRSTSSSFPASKDDLRDIWQKRLRYQQLIQHNINGKEGASALDIALQKALQLCQDEIQELISQPARLRFKIYLNTFLRLNDFQSAYLTASDRSNWNTNFNRSLVGIGIQIEIQNGYPVIKNVLENSPALKSGQLSKGDILLQIKNEGTPAIDLFTMKLPEVMDHIRGPVNSTVTLTIRKPNGTEEKVTLRRASIPFNLVKALTFQAEDTTYKTGYLRIPRFYGGASGAAIHTRSALEVLLSDSINGMIIDLRNNQGGSAGETLKMLDYFIPEGPLMYLSDRDGNIDTRVAQDEQVLFDGPVIILVNERSGSGSELFAGTMQDYGRAIIVGGSATYGKGSRQQFFDLPTPERGQQTLPAVKLSIGNFYTASGKTPQYKGISPDIQLPDDFTYLTSGERSTGFSIKVEDLNLIECSQNIIQRPDLTIIKARSDQRVKNSPGFKAAVQKARHLKEQQDQTTIPLDPQLFSEHQQNQHTIEALNANIKLTDEELYVDIPHLPAPLSPFSEEQIAALKKDIYLFESYQVLADWINQI